DGTRGDGGRRRIHSRRAPSHQEAQQGRAGRRVPVPRLMPRFFHYRRWDGSQKVELDADELLGAMADDVLADGDPWRALQRLMHQGVPPGENQRRRGLQDVLKELRKRRQDRLDRYDVGSSLDDIKKKLDDVIKTEREGIDRRVNEAREGTEQGKVPKETLDKFEKAVAKNRQALDQL